MSGCELCGREEILSLSLVEGVELKVCKKCSSFGKAIKKPVYFAKKVEAKPQSQEPQIETIESIRPDFPKLIRDKREKLGLKQEEFARFLTERVSLIHKIEQGEYTPPIEMAKKIEKQLNISLIETNQVLPQHIKAKPETFTIGDIVKVK